ncbi:hypothetical protein [Blastococcus sp. TBT05-19]|uniref:hypothetical protein n=1 Tax=Blastococcus sp. TBT05-19 TaxID=2250581 RepID=UPI000DEB43C6|nr:hypothetical protein [Blastococcus sp. TBT05-19]
MSSAERARIGVAAALLALVAGCAGQAEAEAPAAASSSPARAADDTTRRIAEVEFVRQCTIASTSFVDEADITTDLDARLAAAGFSHQEWKDWHDALVDSPELVEQFAEISAPGCPGA